MFRPAPPDAADGGAEVEGLHGLSAVISGQTSVEMSHLVCSQRRLGMQPHRPCMFRPAPPDAADGGAEVEGLPGLSAVISGQTTVEMSHLVCSQRRLGMQPHRPASQLACRQVTAYRCKQTPVQTPTPTGPV